MSNSLHDDPLSSEASSLRSGEDGRRGESKRCPKCSETKPRDAFSRDKRNKDGLQSHCKACCAAYRASHRDQTHAYNAAYRAAHRASNAAYCAAYYAAHRDQLLAYHAAYRAANRDTMYAANAAYHAAHRDQIRAYHTAYNAAYRRAHPDKIRAYSAAWHRNNPDVGRASCHRRRVKLKGNGGAGVSSAELGALRTAQNGFCAYCGLPWIAPLHIDHVIPIDQGGPHEIANIVLACPDCNHQKINRTPEQWTNRWYYARLQ